MILFSCILFLGRFVDLILDLLVSPDVLERDATLRSDDLGVVTAVFGLLEITEFLVLVLLDVSEAPVAGLDDELLTGELHLGTAEGFTGDVDEARLGADGDKDLTDADTGAGRVGLTVRLAHTGLETIGTSAGKHLVDTEDVEGVSTDAHVEGFLGGVLGHVLVGLDTSGFEGFRGDLFEFTGDDVDAGGEGFDVSLTGTEIVGADLGVGNTTAETRLGVRLVLAEAVATGRTAAHGCCLFTLFINFF